MGKFIIMGAQFEGVKGGTAINDLITGVTPVPYDEEGVFEKTAAQIQIPNIYGGYNTYFYIDGAWDIENQKEVVGWADVVGNLTDAEITPGIAVWAKSVGADANVNVSGAVSSDETASIDCPTSFALRANVFPISIDVNGGKMTSKDLVAVPYDEEGDFEKTATQIQIPNIYGGYNTYFYIDGAWDIENQTEVVGWADVVGNLTDASIPAAQGFWVKGVSGKFTLEFTK